MKKVNLQQLELNKPSELCQIVCMDEKRNMTGELTATQMDLMNLLLYKSREKIIKESINDISEFFNLELELSYINETLGFNKRNVYQAIVSQLIALKSQMFVLNALGKNKDIETTITNFIHKIKFTKHRETIKKNVSLVLDGEIIGLLVNTKKYFSKMFLTIQFSMVSKYSKALYEILKDYEGVKTVTIELMMLNGLLNVDTTKPSNIQWSSFRPNVLEKAIAEINEKSDIFVSYEPIKEKIDGKRRIVSQIKFNIKKQSDKKLKELGLIKPGVETLEHYKRSKDKLDKLIKNGYNVVDEEIWISTDIKKHCDRYEQENRLDIWLRETPQELQNTIYKMIASKLENCEDISVYIEDYKILGLFSKDAFTRNPNETMELLNIVVDEYNEIYNDA